MRQIELYRTFYALEGLWPGPYGNRASFAESYESVIRVTSRSVQASFAPFANPNPEKAEYVYVTSPNGLEGAREGASKEPKWCPGMNVNMYSNES